MRGELSGGGQRTSPRGKRTLAALAGNKPAPRRHERYRRRFEGSGILPSEMRRATLDLGKYRKYRKYREVAPIRYLSLRVGCRLRRLDRRAPARGAARAAVAHGGGEAQRDQSPRLVLAQDHGDAVDHIQSSQAASCWAMPRSSSARSGMAEILPLPTCPAF